MQTSLSRMSPAWLYHLPDSVTHSTPMLTAMRMLHSLIPSADIVQTPQLPCAYTQALAGHIRPSQNNSNKAAQCCHCCMHSPCLCKDMAEALHTSCPDSTSTSSLHGMQQLTAAVASPLPSLQQQLTRVTSLQGQHAVQYVSSNRVYAMSSWDMHAQQRGFSSTASCWQEAQQASKQKGSQQQPQKQQPQKQQPQKQQPQKQQPGSQQPGKQQPGRQGPRNQQPSNQQPGKQQASSGQSGGNRSATPPNAGSAQQQGRRPQQAQMHQPHGSAMQRNAGQADPAHNHGASAPQAPQTPGMPQSTPFTASLSRAPSAPQRPQNTFQPQGARQQTPMSFQQRTSRGPDQMPRPRPSVPGYGHPAGRPPYRPPSSPSSNSSVSDLEAAKKAAPVYANSRLNFRAPPSEAPDAKQQRVNSDITAPEVRLVNADGTHEVLPLAQALKAAQDASLDLVEVAGHAKPPVCRLLDASKVKFEAKVKERNQDKRLQEQKRSTVMKEMHFGANTAEHDLQVKLKKAREFVEKGHKVKCSVKYKFTRDMQDAQKALPALQERMAEFAEVVLPPPTERQIRGSLSFYLNPGQAAKQQQDSLA